MSKVEVGKCCDNCSAFWNRFAASLASTPLSQLYFDRWTVQSRLLAERSRSDSPAQMSIHLVLATLSGRLFASLASTPLSQLYLDGWTVQSRLLAERSRSDNPTQMSIHLVLATFLNRFAASLASTPLSQLYLDGWTVQSRLLAERSRSENPTQMSIMAYMYSLKRCEVFSIRAIQRICHVVRIALLDAESAKILAGIGRML